MKETGIQEGGNYYQLRRYFPNKKYGFLNL